MSGRRRVSVTGSRSSNSGVSSFSDMANSSNSHLPGNAEPSLQVVYTCACVDAAVHWQQKQADLNGELKAASMRGCDFEGVQFDASWKQVSKVTSTGGRQNEAECPGKAPALPNALGLLLVNITTFVAGHVHVCASYKLVTASRHTNVPNDSSLITSRSPASRGTMPRRFCCF